MISVPSNQSQDLIKYDVKWIDWNNQKTAIIMQNQNGPCPLISLMNVLLLSNRVEIPSGKNNVTSEFVLAKLGDSLLDKNLDYLSQDEQINFEHSISDAMSIFPKLQTGIDVNIKFTTVDSFEYTQDLNIFDVFRIPLYHGWLPDPQDQNLFELINDVSYNQLVERIISSQDHLNPVKIQEGLLCKEFLENTASQLTEFGVISIHEKMLNHQLAILFRNNHFSVIYKHKMELFTLVTDKGYLRKSNIVWETLSSVSGDTYFTDSKFLSAPTESDETNLHPAENQNDDVSTISLSEQLDHQLALKINEELNERPNFNEDFSRQTSKNSSEKSKCLIQ